MSIFAENLEDFCLKRSGRILERYQCPNTSFPLLTKVCLFKNDYDELHFTDGCTGPSGGHRSLFLKSCIAHDLCYHHEPASNNLSQKQCDEEFLKNLTRACGGASDEKKCNRWAKIMYRTLRGFGSLAYRCDNQFVRTYEVE